MPRYGVSITKSVSWRGVQQEFSNVYYYNGSTLSAADATTLAGNIKAIEVPLHSTDVTFLRYKVWQADLSPAGNLMVNQGTLSGTGNQTLSGSLDRERAVLIRFRAGNDSRGRPVYLRKWFHCSGNCVGVIWGQGDLQGTSQISGANKTTIQNQADDLLTVTVGANTYNLVSKTGRAGGTPVECHPYLEHHQLGDMWRG